MKKLKKLLLLQLMIFISISAVFNSCDVYTLDDKEPDWLGASIYNYLETDGRFTNYLQLVKDLDYVQVLSKTGSKTLFVATDEAFARFYQNNSWGVRKYEDLTQGQKSLILNYGMINNAYLVDMLANYNNGGFKEGAAMRRVTAVSVIDSVPYVYAPELPSTPYWDFFRQEGMYLLKDNTPLTVMYFTQKHMEQAMITDEDFSFITGLTREENDAHIFGIKIIEKDITCKNGYLNVMAEVMVPPVNMAEYINTTSNVSMFAKIMNRFCAPFFDAQNTVQYTQLHPEFSDSIYVKKYFARVGGSTTYPNGQSIPSDLLLPFDPGWNSYTRTASDNALQSDMAAMFVPTNQAMTTYLESGSGKVLKDRFGSWDSIPNDIIPLFIKRHMRTSFIESIPSRFSTMVDEDNSLLSVSKNDIENVYIGSNGLIYETNKVYPPDDYVSVYGPVLLSANDASPVNKTKIWKWAILQNDFRLYLNSLVSRYSFFVPTDEYFKDYIDIISLGQDVTAAIKFWFNEKTKVVNATVYAYDLSTKTLGDSIGLITTDTYIKNRLTDMLNSHIVVGDVESGKNYYITKGNVAVKVTGTGENLRVQSGGNIALNEHANATKYYGQSNGKTYFLDKIIQAPQQSVYKVMSSTPEFSEFFDLMTGFPATSTSVVFVNKTNYYGIDFNVKFFNTFNYTVYVPTNSAIEQAIKDELIMPWDSAFGKPGINDLTDATVRAAQIVKLERFIRYHIQDNSVFVDNVAVDKIYQSATIKLNGGFSYFNTFTNKYYKIGVKSTGGNLSLTTEQGKSVNVLTNGGLYNIMTRDYVFNNRPSAFKNADGTGVGLAYTSSNILTSSTAVIHQIDNILNFE